MTANTALPKAKLALINLGRANPLAAACGKCGGGLFESAFREITDESNQLQADLKAAIFQIPIVSVPNPMGWTYKPITIITAQTVTGTGIFSDISSAFTDLFGAQSGAYNTKLRDGENMCKSSLRAQAIELGANAVIGVDVDYAEVGGQRAMLMVCMTGTAVRVTKTDDPDEEFLAVADAAHRKAKRAREIEEILRGLPNQW
jgi:uncharacterized protein YbjQ (UPF0145 family)